MLTHPLNRVPRAGSFSIRVLGLTAALSIVGATAPSERLITIPAGTKIVGELSNTISTRTSEVGDRVEMRTVDPVRIDDNLRLVSGMVLKGEVTKSERGGRVTEKAEMSVLFTRLEVDGRQYSITTEPFRVMGKSEAKNSAKKAIGGAVVGGVVGAIAGDAKKGLLIGAVLGSGVAVATKGGHITLAEGQRIQVRLAEPVTVNARTDIAYAPR